MKNKLIKKISVAYIISLLISCSSNPKIPVWEIRKDGTPTSYIMASSNHLSKDDIDKMLTNNIIGYFDSCKNYITFWDLQNSDLLEAKQWIEIGNDYSLKDTLSEISFSVLKSKISQYNTESSLKAEMPDSVKIKPNFYVNDIITRNRKGYFNIEQFFLTRAMPQQKEVYGLETFQSYYKSYSKVDFEEYIANLTQVESIVNELEQYDIKTNELFKSNSFEELVNQQNIQTKIGLSSNELLKKNSNSWTDKVDSILTTNKTFILLDINYINPYNNLGLYQKLLSKGYQIKRIN